MVTVGRDDTAPTPFGLQVVLPHQAAELLVVNHYALMAQRSSHATVSVAFKLVADLTDPGKKLIRRKQHG